MFHRRRFLASSLAATAAASLPEMADAAPLAPFKLYDTHAHLHSTDVAKYPFRQDMTPALQANTLAHSLDPETLFKLWDDAGVEMGCAVTLNVIYYTDNRYLLDMAEKYPKRLSPVVVLDPLNPATPASLKSMVKAYGVSGIRFAGDPDAKGDYPFLTDAAHGAWEMANELGLAVVLLPVRPASLLPLPAAMKRVGELAAKYPNVNIVLDHVGFPVAERTPTFGFSPEHLALTAHRNVYYKYTSFIIAQLVTGGVPLKDFLSYVAGHYGADRLLWGSAIGNNEVGFRGQFSGGAGLGDTAQYRRLVNQAFDSAEGLTLDQKKAMFHDNAKRLFVPGGHARAG